MGIECNFKAIEKDGGIPEMEEKCEAESFINMHRWGKAAS